MFTATGAFVGFPETSCEYELSLFEVLIAVIAK